MALTYGHWYLVGWCQERDAVRWFRWDRVRDAYLTREPVTERDLSVIGEFPPTARPVGPRRSAKVTHSGVALDRPAG